MPPYAPGIVVNRYLPQQAKLSESQFLERVAKLEAIRTQKATVHLLVGEKHQMAQLEELHAAVHSERLTSGLNSFSLSPLWVPFILELPLPLHQWLAEHSLAEIRAQVVNWLAALYTSHCRRFQMWRTLLPEIKQWANAHYSKYIPREADELIEVWADEYDAAQALVGGTRGVLDNPFRGNERPFLDATRVQASIEFVVRVGYFREDDWLCIVERSRSKVRAYYKSNLDDGGWTERTIDQIMRHGTTDNMDRAEAKRDLWQAWNQHFPTAALATG